MSGSINNLLAQGVQMPAPANPLDVYGKMQGIVNAQSQNRLQQQQLLNSQQELTNMQTSNRSAEQDISSKQLGMLGGLAAGVVYGAPPGSLTPAYVRSQIEVAAGHFPGMAGLLRQAEGQISDTDTPEILQQKMMTLALQSQAPNVSQQMAKPDSKLVNQGGFQQTYNTPQPGFPGANVPVPVGPQINVGPSRLELASPVTGTDNRPTVPGPDGVTQIPNPNLGRPYRTTTGNRVGQQAPGLLNPPPTSPQGTALPTGAPGSAAPAVVQPAPTAMPPSAPVTNTTAGITSQPLSAPAPTAAVGQPASAQPVLKPASAPVQTAPAQTTAQPPQVAQAAPEGGTYTGPSPMQGAALDASSKLYAEHQQNSANYAAQTTPLSKIYQLATAKGVTTGPGTDFWTNVYSLVNAQAPDFIKKMGITPDPTSLANREQLGKYLVQSTMSLPGATQSDSQLASAFSGNANTHISSLAVQDVVKTQFALRRMQQAGLLAFQQQFPDAGTAAQGSGGYANFLSKWQQTIDPRAFEYDMLSGSQYQKMRAGMTKDEGLKFDASLAVAKNSGVLDQKPPAE